ncbi:uncharacterized protein LOC105427087 [Pogonomyrmex barbatus]|uniref:Uncharacterized protein LOC105427087 n=1 Tax=Pogonomyrmex barbatus TaxID=144034 RepID=A0A6I9WY94_9HYME|nr:uncharacterized protein LOC105427087 [Pogonomyrmex barbatus]
MPVNVLEPIKKGTRQKIVLRTSGSRHPRDSHQAATVVVAMARKEGLPVPVGRVRRCGWRMRTEEWMSYYGGMARPEGGWLEQRGTTAPPSGNVNASRNNNLFLAFS